MGAGQRSMQAIFTCTLMDKLSIKMVNNGNILHELTYNYQVEFHLFQELLDGKYYVEKSVIKRRTFLLLVTY